MFEILMYLFENYMDNSIQLNVDQQTVMDELEMAGFHPYEIDRALDWFYGLVRIQETVQPNLNRQSYAIRHYSLQESEHIGLKERNFLLHLEQLGILDPATREIVIDRLMALDGKEMDFGHMQWVVLIALFNQPDKKAALSLLQDMIVLDVIDVLH